MSIPTAIWEGSFILFGVLVHCYVMADGQRIINAEDMYRLMVAMETQDAPIGDLKEFARWQRGI